MRQDHRTAVRPPDVGRAHARSAALLAGGLALCAGLAAVLVAHLAHLLSSTGGPLRVEALVDVGVSATGALVTLWLGASTLVALACVGARAVGATWRSGERLVLRCAPTVVRRALVLALGAGLGLGVTTSATATEHPADAARVTATAGTDLDVGWTVTTPDGASAVASDAPTAWQAMAPAPAAVSATTTAPAPTRTPSASAPGTPDLPAPVPGTPDLSAPAPSTPTVPPSTAAPTTSTPVTHLVAPPVRPTEDAGPATVVVVRGDSLWRIAARHLPPGADDAQIAAAWPAWYAANSDVVGPDPGVLLPGQVLTVPTTVTADGAGA